MTYEEAKYRAMLRDLGMSKDELLQIIEKCRANGYRVIYTSEKQGHRENE